MIRQLETQDQNGNKIYRHTSSDIVWNLDTGHTVKEDIDTLMAALGIAEGSGGSAPEVNIDAKTLSGHTIEELVLNDTYKNAITELNNAIAAKAPLASPAFTGTPEWNKSSESLSNMGVIEEDVEIQFGGSLYT